MAAINDSVIGPVEDAIVTSCEIIGFNPEEGSIERRAFRQVDERFANVLWSIDRTGYKLGVDRVVEKGLVSFKLTLLELTSIYPIDLEPSSFKLELHIIK